LSGARETIAFSPTEWDVPGKAQGTLAGGNLSVLCSALGSPDFPVLRDAILFLEDVDEYYYHIDRMLRALWRSGSLEGLRGLVLGGFTLMKDHEIPFGQNCEQVIRELFGTLGIPIAFGFPAGHLSENRPLVLGAKVELTSSTNGHSLRYVDR
jgi:muramoyltetrapeptide carboxypeptidase